MILPIYLYGQPVLKKVAAPIDATYPDLDQLIQNMYDTMYAAHGVGLAAPQIGLSIRLFVLDTVQLERDEKPGFKGIKMALINAEILDENGDIWAFEEGCLSIPNIRGDVERPPAIRIRFLDTDFKEHELTFEGMNARVIQHEYDHIEGKLFVEKLKPLKRRLINRRLEAIKKGELEADYKVKVQRPKT